LFCLDSSQQFTVENFTYDNNEHQLLHQQTHKAGMDTGLICDIVAIQDGLFYFTKCFSTLLLRNDLLTTFLRIRSGEIWVYNSNENKVYPVVKHLFVPKAIAYMKARDIIVVTNLDVNGITLYQRHSTQNTLTKIKDIEENSFIFNIFSNSQMNDLIMIAHTSLYQTLQLNKHKNNQTKSYLINIHLNFDKSNDNNEFDYNSQSFLLLLNDKSSFNSISSSILFNDNKFVIFSLINQPNICTL
jgi:hypothetical protein